MSGSTDEAALDRPVPTWEQLPERARRDLAGPGYDEAWFAARAAAPAERLTVLNLYVKLSGVGLWPFVVRERPGDLGCLHFDCGDVARLKAALAERRDFTPPGPGASEWESRERRAEGALHLKHFAGWPEAQVQAHVDPEGLLLGSLAWWLLPLVPLAQMAAHGADPTGYREVERVRALLLLQGWDQGPLLGRGGSPE